MTLNDCSIGNRCWRWSIDRCCNGRCQYLRTDRYRQCSLSRRTLVAVHQCFHRLVCWWSCWSATRRMREISLQQNRQKNKQICTMFVLLVVGWITVLSCIICYISFLNKEIIVVQLLKLRGNFEAHRKIAAIQRKVAGWQQSSNVPTYINNMYNVHCTQWSVLFNSSILINYNNKSISQRPKF